LPPRQHAPRECGLSALGRRGLRLSASRLEGRSRPSRIPVIILPVILPGGRRPPVGGDDSNQFTAYPKSGTGTWGKGASPGFWIGSSQNTQSGTRKRVVSQGRSAGPADRRRGGFHGRYAARRLGVRSSDSFRFAFTTSEVTKSTAPLCRHARAVIFHRVPRTAIRRLLVSCAHFRRANTPVPRRQDGQVGPSYVCLRPAAALVKGKPKASVPRTKPTPLAYR
jgi:hypothetical protein